MAVFSKLFPLKTLMHNVLNAVRPAPFWTLLKFLHCVGWGEYKPGIILSDPSEVVHHKMGEP